jgi:16S rRNA (uracil1498-N3)-methyltransferase
MPHFDEGESRTMTRRRWIADDWEGQTAWLRGEQATHLVRVLRAQAGMECDVVANGRVWRAAIQSVREDAVEFALQFEVESDQALPVTLLLSVFKFDRMEWVFEKATELGVERFIPMIARRSEKHLAQAATGRVERWRRIVHESAKQSRRSSVPVVEDVSPLKTAVEMSRTGLRLVLAEQEQSNLLYAALKKSSLENLDVHLAVGPEGGWTNEEVKLFTDAGWEAVSLGPRILRAETAGIAAMAIVAAVLG